MKKLELKVLGIRGHYRLRILLPLSVLTGIND